MTRTNNKAKNAISPLKNNILDSLLIGLTIFTPPLLIVSILRIFNVGWQNAFTFHIAFYFSLLILTALKNRLNTKAKAIYLSFLLLGTAIIGFANFGFVAGGKYFFIPAVILASLFYSRNMGLVVILLAICITSTFAYLYILGQLEYRFDISSYINNPTSWISNGLAIVSIALIFLFVVSKFESAYNQIYKDKSEQEENYRSLFEQAADGILICDAQGKIILVNQSFCSLAGFEPVEISGKNIESFFSNEELLKSPIRYDLVNQGEVVVSKRRVPNKNGELIEIETRSHKLRDGRIQIIIRDISEINKIRSEWTREKELNDRILNIIPGIFFLWDLNTNIPKLIKWNKNHELLIGKDSYALRGIDIHDFFAEKESPKLDDALKNIRVNQEITLEASVKAANNIETPYFLSAKAISMNKKKYLLGVGLDISDRKAFEAELINSEQKFRDIYNSTSDAIFIVDSKYRVLTANQAFLSLLETTEAALVDMNIFEFVVKPEEKELMMERTRELMKNKNSQFEYIVKNTKGRIFPLETRSKVINYLGQKAILTSCNDISERVSLQKEVVESAINAEEKERERIARELHDGLGPLLSTCRIYLHNLKHLREEDEIEAVTNLEELIDEALHGIKEISNNISPHILRNFGIIHATKSFIERLSEKCAVDFEFNFEPSERFDEIKEITAYRILTELINNTIKHAKATKIKIKINKNNSSLTISYSDNGIGFNFEQVLTQSKGLGISNIKSRINSAGGTLIYNSKPANGINVKINLPINYVT